MGLKLCSLSSGSKGNAILIASSRTAILLDMGISVRELGARMRAAGLSGTHIDGLVVTHSHTDHIRGIDSFCRASQAPVYANQEAWADLGGRLTVPASQRCAFDKSFSIGDIGIHSFDTPHDAPHSKGFCFVCGNEKVSVVTDLGHMTRTIFSYIADSDLVLLESNYDDQMLVNGPYPPFLKRRIGGLNGHLSNRDSGVVAAELARRGTRRLLLGHLSENNNLPELAMAACVKALKENGFEEGKDVAVEVALQYSPSRVYEVDKCGM